MKIKVFSAVTITGLENNVNKFLESESVEVLEVQFSSSVNGLAVMVSYNDVGAHK